jgi:hypothetical protein
MAASSSASTPTAVKTDACHRMGQYDRSTCSVIGLIA